MPSIRKKNVFETPIGSLSADDFNLHTDAILAIERFLGTADALEKDVIEILGTTSDPKNLIGGVRYLHDWMNTFVSKGVVTSSGYINSGQRMIFPENIQATFLANIPSSTDTSMKVTSTFGFPDNGVISILNDVGFTSVNPTSLVEWIRYTGKTATSFLNCERGYLGTTAGSHLGSPMPISTTGELNLQDQCIPLSFGQRICNRRYRGWKAKIVYEFQAFELIGTLLDITREIRLAPETFRLTRDELGNAYDTIVIQAQDLGILGTRDNGDLFLQSANTSYSDLHQLQWFEASTFVSRLLAANLIIQMRTVQDWVVGRSPFVPVFQGMMSIGYAVAGFTINPTPASGFAATTITVPTTGLPGPVVVDGNITRLDVGADGIDVKYASLNPTAVDVDSLGNLFIIDTADGTRIRKINGAATGIADATGLVNTIAGKRHLSGYTGDGGLGPLALVDASCLAVDDVGNVYFGDTTHHVVRKIDATTGIISTIAGNGTAGFTVVDGAVATSVAIDSPVAIDIDSAGNVWFNDTVNTSLLMVSTDGKIYIAVTANVGYALAISFQDGAVFYNVDNQIYKADIISAGPGGVSLGSPTLFAGVAGTGNPIGDGGPATAAQLGTLINSPLYIAIPPTSTMVFINDVDNGEIRGVTSGNIYKAVNTSLSSLIGMAAYDPFLPLIYFIGDTTPHLYRADISALAGGSPPAPSQVDGTQPTPTVITGQTTTGNVSTSEPTPAGIRSMGMQQTADGRLVLASLTDTDGRRPDQGVAQYQIFFVGAARTSRQGNTI